MSTPKRLKGRYKGTRKRKEPPKIIWIECPGCNWRGHPAEVEEAEQEYAIHLERVHYGILECAFCDVSVGRGFRLLPDFQTLAAHVKYFHPKKAPSEDESLPKRAFK